MDRLPCVYILASRINGTLYIGVTSNLARRLYQHWSGETGGFAHRYGATRLVHVEVFDDMPTAIAREKQLKAWRREWKLNLIEHDNPHWEDLAIGLRLTPIAADSGVDAEPGSA